VFENIMKNAIQTWLALSVLLLLVLVTASARTRSHPRPAPPVPGEVNVEIVWKKDMGLLPISPGKNEPSPSACSAFFIFAATLGMGPEKSEIVGHSQPSRKQAKERDGYYVCSYSMQVEKGAFVGVGMGDADAAPKMSRQSYYLTDQWIGGTKSQPPAGWKRGFESPSWPFRPVNSWSIFFQFELVYVPGDNPGPTLDPSTPLGEGGPSPFLSRAHSFAGAWHAKLGDATLELILQQAGKQVTGQVKLNSADVGVIREGIVVGNTLRFKIVRVSRTFGVLREEFMGTGELVMNADGRSFTGNILDTATSGTFVGR
jgi:hypothetical protein